MTLYPAQSPYTVIKKKENYSGIYELQMKFKYILSRQCYPEKAHIPLLGHLLAAINSPQN